jgi:hypothetical protein
MMDDRNYYRRLDDYELLELAKHVNTAELSVVLAERLKKARRRMEADYYDAEAYRQQLTK